MHEEITGPFETPMEVTETCLSCHEDAATEVMKTSHWTWNLAQDVPGKGHIERGKKNVVNNFCISINSNWPRCTSCHISYGWEDANFDFTDQSRVDCLVCHDSTGTYEKVPTGAGMPHGFTGKDTGKSVDLVKVAQNVALPSRTNCVVCHGYGGGGDNVKHGDIDSNMKNPDSEYDVHMGTDGLDFNCQSCHTTEAHQIMGSAMVVSPGNPSHMTCTDCHDTEPHAKKTLNRHTTTVACQSCHIPTFAKGLPTKVYWDWSTAGQDIKPERDKYGKDTYNKKKGSFVWEKDIVPTYAWYNGSAEAYLLGDKINPSGATTLSKPNGDIKDMDAKIYPFKVHKGKQIYDTKNNYLVTPKLFGPKGDPSAYWTTYDWNKAAAAGMEASGLAYSGEYGFTETEMYWSLNHMVAPADKSLKCMDCHGKKGRFEWDALGYKGDPMLVRGAARD
jgi:octaheme c-type cytochrome (tetrathionate reductase family)